MSSSRSTSARLRPFDTYREELRLLLLFASRRHTAPARRPLPPVTRPLDSLTPRPLVHPHCKLRPANCCLGRRKRSAWLVRKLLRKFIRRHQAELPQELTGELTTERRPGLTAPHNAALRSGLKTPLLTPFPMEFSRRLRTKDSGRLSPRLLGWLPPRLLPVLTRGLPPGLLPMRGFELGTSSLKPQTTSR
jgi:hypothetical protein